MPEFSTVVFSMKPPMNFQKNTNTLPFANLES